MKMANITQISIFIFLLLVVVKCENEVATQNPMEPPSLPQTVTDKAVAKHISENCYTVFGVTFYCKKPKPVVKQMEINESECACNIVANHNTGQKSWECNCRHKLNDFYAKKLFGGSIGSDVASEGHFEN